VPSEEERAALHRQNLAARASWYQARELALAGDPDALAALRAKFAPVLERGPYDGLVHHPEPPSFLP
jgi:hypothetical protein